MSKPSLKTSSIAVKERVKTAPERLQELFAEGKYTHGLRLLGRIARDGALEHWRSIFLINTGQFTAAQSAIEQASKLGYAGHIASLAVLHRLTQTNRDWLLALKKSDFTRLNTFDRALLEREMGTEHLTRDDLASARVWFERSWRTATTNSRDASLLPGIGEMLGHVWALLGHHVQAIDVYTESLKHANADRRVALLLQRALSRVVMQQFKPAESDLLDAKTFIPTLATDPSLKARLLYIDGRLLHARGDLNAALTLFEEAVELGHQAQHDVEFFALLWGLTTTIELDRFESVFPSVANGFGSQLPDFLDGADIYQFRAQDFLQLSEQRYQKAWLELRHALLDVRQPVKRAAEQEANNARAWNRTEKAIEGFEAIGARWEIGAIWLLRAEISLAAVYSSDQHPEKALERALTVARELGGPEQYATELRALPRLMAYLERSESPALYKEFLNALKPHDTYSAVWGAVSLEVLNLENT